ncbi:MAG: FHA domain-containing protein [Kiritimatiellia bacterium]
MSFSLVFAVGGPTDAPVPVVGELSVLGRSRSCDIRTAPDNLSISGRHLSFAAVADGLEMTNLSAHRTLADGHPLAQGAKVVLRGGERVEIGNGCVFVVRVDGLAPAQAVPEAQGDETVLPEAEPPAAAPADEPGRNSPPASAGGASAVSETVWQQTQLAGSEEIEKLKEQHARARTRRMMMKVMGAALVFLGVAASYYFFVRKIPERVLSWPCKADGQYDRQRQLFDVPFGKGAVGLEYPGDPSCRVDRQTNGTTTVTTRLGKYRDVPYRLTFSCRQDADFLHKDRARLFAELRERLEERGGWNFQAVSPVQFLGPDNGIPAMDVQYYRAERQVDDTQQWFGHLLFVVHGDCAITVAREIPAAEEWRGGPLLAANVPLLFTSAVVSGHWEGSPAVRVESPTRLLAEAEGLMSGKAVFQWQEISFLIQSALVSSSGRGHDGERALALLRQLRLRQSREFTRLRILWEQHRRLGESDACKRTIAEALKIFSSPDDHRNLLLRKGVWE